MEITIKGGPELSAEDFKSILALDCKVFGNTILINEGMAEKRFLKFKDGIIAAYTGNRLMGFINFYSVDASVYERAVFRHEYIDDDLNESKVVPLKKDRGNQILILDLAVDDAFRHQGVSRRLHESLWDYLGQKHRQGYLIDRVFCFAITTEGFKSMLSLGSSDIWTRDNITLFELNQEIFLGQL